MRVSNKCQYALRAVFELAWRNTGRPVKTHELAAAQRIPPRFLEAILNELRHAGLVESRRGSKGGYMLGKPTEELNIAEIIQVIEGPALVASENSDRVSRGGRSAGDYAFSEFWKQMNTAVAQLCAGTSFAELVDREMAQNSTYVPNYVI